MPRTIPAALAPLLSAFPQAGRLEWIGLRPARDVPMRPVDSVHAEAGRGLAGDRYRGGGKRQVTLVQAEHLPLVAALLQREAVVPSLLRRNLAVSGINVLALRTARFRVGEVELEGTGPCEPCHRMEEALGRGGYNALRGHGGITARVLRSGTLRRGDAVEFLALAGDAASDTSGDVLRPPVA